MAQLDSNVLLRHLLADHETHSPRATALLSRVSSGSLTVEFAETTLFEVVFTLYRSYKKDRIEIVESLTSFLVLSGVRFPENRRALAALNLFGQFSMDFGDAYIAALALESDGQVISFDRDFDRIPGVTRVEP
jgi:predicted nucleic acid-binding protein